MQITRAVAPASAPILLSEAKEHCRVLHDDDDAYLTVLIDAATAYLDGPTGILGNCILTQTWRVDLTDWSDPIDLPVSPVASVIVAYTDAAGTAQTLSASSYVLTNDQAATPAIWLASGAAWPQLGDVPYPVRITAVCGAALCPADLKVAILMLVGHWYLNRVPVSADAMEELPVAFSALIAPRRRLVT